MVIKQTLPGEQDRIQLFIREVMWNENNTEEQERKNEKEEKGNNNTV